MKNVFYENDQWIKEAFGLIYDDPKYHELLTMPNVLLTLAIPLVSQERSQVVMGVFSQDSPSALVPVEEMKISYPEAKFIFNYPTKQYIFLEVPENELLNQAELDKYAKIFGEPQHYGKYFKNLYHVLDTGHYDEIISKTLGYGWLTDRGEEKEIITLHVKALANFFEGVPTILRDFYLAEGRPFFDWMLKYL